MKLDRLFMTWNCDECVSVRALLTHEAVFGELDGNDGQGLVVVYAFSDDGARELLDRFDMDDVFTPAVLTHRDEVIDGVDEVNNRLEVVWPPHRR